MAKAIRIIKFFSENFMRLRTVGFDSAGQVVRLAGKNGSGKSSVITAIECALTGAKAIPDVPIRRGAEKGIVRVELSNGRIIERRFTSKSDSLHVSGIENAAQTYLNTLVSPVTFDPLAFSRKTEAEQYRDLRSFIKGVDFEALEKANVKDFQQRTEVNRDIKANQIRLAAFMFTTAADVKPVDVAELSKQITLAHRHNAAITGQKQSADLLAKQRESAFQALQKLKDGYPALVKSWEEDLEAEIARLRFVHSKRVESEDAKLVTQLEVLETIETQIKECQPPTDPIDIAPLEEQMGAATTINADCERRKDQKKIVDELKRLAEQERLLTRAMDDRAEQIRNAMDDAKIPGGLVLSEGHVLWNKVPFSQASKGESIRVSAQVIIELLKDRELKVMFVQDAQLLDDEQMKILVDIAIEHDFQLWLELVHTGEPGAIVLEDGSIVESDVPEQPSLLEGQDNAAN